MRRHADSSIEHNRGDLSRRVCINRRFARHTFVERIARKIGIRHHHAVFIADFADLFAELFDIGCFDELRANHLDDDGNVCQPSNLFGFEDIRIIAVFALRNDAIIEVLHDEYGELYPSLKRQLA